MEHEGDNYTNRDFGAFATVTKGSLKELEDLEIREWVVVS